MELFFKLPEGKPPFIGVIFENSEQAELNKDLLEYPNAKFSILVEAESNNSMTFRLSTDKLVRRYEKVKMDYSAYKKWRAYSHLKMNFAHILLIHDQPVVVKINKKLFIIQIESFIQG
ncbi:MAG: hypothetical protein IPJ32_04555 [Sphingobacteriaceae bacterium]|nr:hypothetical protein [Sphingobacteriaceae bacterium]